MESLQATWAARDLVDRGGPVRLRVVSRHNHVINLQADEWKHMVMLADPEVYKGPASAGLDMLDFRALQSCVKPGDAACFREGEIEFYGSFGIRVSLNAAERVSFSVPPNVKYDAAAIGAASVRDSMAELAAPHLCSCLLKDGGFPADPFAETLTREFPRLLRSLADGTQNEFIDAASAIVGLGYGSTPTGDDLIHGALVALHYLKRITHKNLTIPSLPRSICAKTTLLGAHMLETGILGLTSEPVRNFALNLLAGNPIEPTFADLRRMGSDSGCTSAVGFYLMVLESRKSLASIGDHDPRNDEKQAVKVNSAYAFAQYKES